MSETKELSFEGGYERLRTIAGRLNEEEVPVSEMCDLFAEGKGLEQALTTFLDEQRERVEAIERGEGIRVFKITTTAPAGGDDIIEDDFQPVPVPKTLAGAGDDDIPF
jgi:exodeoxyribonuclease VII small subunit